MGVGYTDVGVPALVAVSTVQGPLNAGAEAVVNIALPFGLVIPPNLSPSVVALAFCGVQVVAAEANVVYLATLNGLSAFPGTAVSVKVRNVGSANGGANFRAFVMMLGAGGAIGI
jgi:hypothetical protein